MQRQNLVIRLLAALACLLLMAAPTGDATPENGQLLVTEALDLGGSRALLRAESPDADAQAADLLSDVELRTITYVSDGLHVRGYLALPRKGDAPLPCVIYNRGGNRSFGALTDESAAHLLAPIARAGYVVVASQYRGSGGGKGRDEFGGRDVNDVLNLIPLLESVPRADATRIGMVGWSRGGMMTYLALSRTQRIAAAVVLGGEADLLDGMRQRPEMAGVYEDLIPEYAASPDSALAARSVAQWPERLHKGTPILIVHGGSDWRVDPGQSLLLAKKLWEVRHPFRLVLFEGGDHGLSEHRDEVRELMLSWLHRYVRDRRPWPSLEPHGS
jgi:dipeptidyl aminopeptidase/acylaminoacyl peptidase